MSALDTLERPELSISRYELVDPRILQKPADVPADYIAYNPSRIHTVFDGTHEPFDVMYARRTRCI